MIEAIEIGEPLSDFFSAIEKDSRVSITHIGIYASLLYCKRTKGLSNPMVVFSHEIMRLAKISSPSTYLKCVRDLSDFGYIHYEPSFNKNIGSKIYFAEKILESKKNKSKEWRKSLFGFN